MREGHSEITNRNITKRILRRILYGSIAGIFLVTAGTIGTILVSEKSEKNSYRGLPSPTQSEIVLARAEREQRVERKRLVEAVGTAFDFNGDAQWSYEEEAFAKAFYLSGSGERKKTYEQVLRNYPTSYLEQVELKIPDKQRKLNGERK